MDFLRKNQFYILLIVAAVVLYPMIKKQLEKVKGNTGIGDGKTTPPADTKASYYGQPIEMDDFRKNPIL